MCKTRLATKAAGSYGFLDFFIGHAFSPSTEIPTSVGNASVIELEHALSIIPVAVRKESGIIVILMGDIVIP